MALGAEEMSLRDDILRPFWPAILIILGAGAIIGATYGLDARIESKAQSAAVAAVSTRWDEVYQAKALQACTSAADAGAYRAISEAMQQSVIPMQRLLDSHIAVQAEHERQDGMRFDRIERRLGL